MKLNLNAPVTELKVLYKKAKDAYYNSGTPVLTDRQFDDLEDYLKDVAPNWSGFKAGAKVKVGKKQKVKLPIPMFSLDKKKADTVDRWLSFSQADEYVISEKLDGSALELIGENGVPTRLITRGNGTIGGDVSFMIPHLKIPRKVGTANFILRCEGLFSKAKFNQYANEFDSARNAASGILNRQDIHHSMRDLDIMVLQVMEPNWKPSRGLAWAKSKGFQVVPYKVVPKKKLSSRGLLMVLDKRTAVSKYQIDGLVITEDKVNRHPTSGNPDWAVAFKSNVSAENAPVTTVREVEWEVSSHGYIQPVIVYDPVDWDGSELTRATAFNAKFVIDNRIGVGSKVAILRSGEIIPFIAKVVKPATKTSKPDPRVFGAYSLDKRGTYYVLDKPTENHDFRIKKIARFFANIGVEFMKEQTIRKLYDVGFTNVRKFVRATPQMFMKAEGIQSGTANKIHTEIHRVLDAGIPLIRLMDASGVFPRGMGETRFTTISQHTDLMKLCAADEHKQLTTLIAIPGFQDTTARMFMKGAPKFIRWMEVTGITYTKKKEPKPKLSSNKLNGLGVTWTSYRNAEEEQIVQTNGGQVVPFGSRTQVLLFKPGGKESSKIGKAESKGIPVMTWDKFSRKYGV